MSCKAHLASHAMRTGSIPEVKKPGRGLSSAFMDSSRVNFTAQNVNYRENSEKCIPLWTLGENMPLRQLSTKQCIFNNGTFLYMEYILVYVYILVGLG